MAASDSGKKRATDDDSSLPASSSGGNSRWTYEVFLSFRGEDTRNKFTDHLYYRLRERKICTFRDDERLEKGKEISSELWEAIERSKVSVIILSRKYASSTWCLDELTKIVECMKAKDQIVLPVFYKVDPSDVRKQRGAFKRAFDKHKKNFKDNPEKVERWKSALTWVANLAGWRQRDGSEANLITDIVDRISERLNQIQYFPVVHKKLVGMGSRVEEIYEHLRLDISDEIRFVGIWGMGGIGKTTIARVVYERLSYKYEGHCFLANVREVSEKEGLESLQKKLLCRILKEKDLNTCDCDTLIARRLRRKVFIVLDDVNQSKQLKKLAEREWFGSGSRIIITTRDEGVLKGHGIKHICKVRGLDNDEAHRLFCLKAYNQIRPTADGKELSNSVVCYADGLPLALDVLGSLLCDTNVNEWKSALERLETVPNEEIVKMLRISYNELGRMDKKIFLDIACFFKGKDVRKVKKLLDSCNFQPDFGINVLKQRSLITIQDNKLQMHDLVQGMGWEVIREEHPDEPGKWSRLWRCEDVYRMLATNKATPIVEGIIPIEHKRVIPIEHKKDITLVNGKCFSTMSNLRFLNISNVHISKNLKFLSNELRILKWRGYPLKTLPSSFHPRKLLRLNLCYSRIEYLWKRIKFLGELRTINLSYSQNLLRTPNFTLIPNLERLDLQYCTRLHEVDQSVGYLGRLVMLNLNNCKNLVKFPYDVSGLKSLKILNLRGCSKLERLPFNLEEMEQLEELDIAGTAIREVPSTTAQFGRLKTLSLQGQHLPAWPQRRLIVSLLPLE